MSWRGGLPVRITDLDGAPWFVAKDVCEALGISDVRQAVGRLDEDERSGCSIPTPGGNQTSRVVSESGLYALIMQSRKPEAKRFRKWVTSEVLPSIRKTGGYVVATREDTPEIIMARGMLAAGEAAGYSKILLQRPCPLPTDSIALSDG